MSLFLFYRQLETTSTPNIETQELLKLVKQQDLRMKEQLAQARANILIVLVSIDWGITSTLKYLLILLKVFMGLPVLRSMSQAKHLGQGHSIFDVI
jgi:hypothetical protein